MKKAKEYYDKYRIRLIDVGTRNRSVHALIIEFNEEALDLMSMRNVRFDMGVYPIIKELNDKWNAIARLFQREYGTSPIAENGYRRLWLRKMPELKEKI